MTKSPRFVSFTILLSVILWGGQAGTQSAPPPQNQTRQENSSLTLEFTTAVYSNKTKQPLNGLGSTDFRLYEDGAEQRITAVELESKPLSVMLVMVLGVTGDCYFLDLSQFTTWLSGAMRKNLKAGEEVGMAITDREGTILLQFGEVEKSLRWALGSTDAEDSHYWKANRGNEPWREFDSGKVGESTALNTMKVVGEIEEPNSDDGGYLRRNPGAISVNPQNHLNVALINAADYLLRYRKNGHRPAIIMCNSIYNVTPISKEAENELNEFLFQKHVVVSWIGKPYGGNYFSSPEMKKHVSSSNAEHYQPLPGKTGGATLNCSHFSPTKAEPSFFSFTPGYKKAYQKFSDEVGLLLEHLRSRYRISYLSSNPNRDGKLRQLRLELAPKWKKQKPVIEAPQAIIPPTSQVRTP